MVTYKINPFYMIALGELVVAVSVILGWGDIAFLSIFIVMFYGLIVVGDCLVETGDSVFVALPMSLLVVSVVQFMFSEFLLLIMWAMEWLS